MSESAFARFMRKSRESRLWTLADLSRAAGLSQSEVSRIESGARLPTMRHVKGLAEAFSSSPKTAENEPVRYESWVAHLVDLGERARIDGFEGLEVRPISGGYGLFIDDTLIAAALSDDAADATEKLLDRCADKFFHDIMEV